MSWINLKFSKNKIASIVFLLLALLISLFLGSFMTKYSFGSNTFEPFDEIPNPSPFASPMSSLTPSTLSPDMSNTISPNTISPSSSPVAPP